MLMRSSKIFLAEFRFTAGRGEWTASFFSTASVKTESKEPEQVGHCLWLEYHRIDAGFEHARITSIERFANRFVCDASGVEFRDIKVIAKKISGTGPSGVRAVVDKLTEARLFVDEVAVLRGRSTG